jgi:hypothetical protein
MCVKKNRDNQTGPKLLVRVQFPFPSRKHQPAAIAIPLPSSFAENAASAVHFPKYFIGHPSHRIFRPRYGTLNVGKKITNCTVCL